jgi:hypothetical protein
MEIDNFSTLNLLVGRESATQIVTTVSQILTGLPALLGVYRPGSRRSHGPS